MSRGWSLGSVLLGLATLFGLATVLWRVQVALPPPSAMPGPGAVILTALLLALLSEVPAGFVTGRIAPDRPLAHALVVAGVAALVAGFWVAGTGATGFLGGVLLGTLQTPAIVFGAWLAARHPRSPAGPHPR